MFAENFLDLLTRKNFIPSDLAEELRERIAPMPRAIPAEVFAKRLVDQGIITQNLADSLLQQLQSPTPPTRPSTPLPPPLPPSRPATPPPLPHGQVSLSPSPNNTLLTSVPPILHAPPQSSPKTTDLFVTEVFPQAQDLPPIQDRFRTKSFATKKKVKNPWDTKLILFGGTGLLLLIFVSLFLFSSLVRRNAEGMFDKANQSFQSGDASQAIVEFSEYLTAFPNHSAASTARIRLALARIRLVVDVKSDWLKACNTALEEIEPVRNEPTFFDESKAELAVLLPKIAVGLSTEAESKLLPEYARRSAEMLELIDALIPPSLRPMEQIADARSRNEKVWKRLNRDKSLAETQQNLESLLKNDSPDPTAVEQCYQAIDTLLRDYPELENDPRLLELLRNISIFEARTIRTLTTEQVINAGGTPAFQSPSYEIASLYFQDRKQTSSANTPPSHILLAAKGMLFALRSDTGVPVWKKQIFRPLPQNSGAWHVGLPVWEKHPSRPKSSVLQILPLPRPNPDSTEFALLVDPDQGQIDQVDAASGTTLCRWFLDEPIFVSEPVLSPSNAEVVFAVTTHTGKLIVFALDLSGKRTPPRILACQLPQRINSAPVVDSTGNHVFQFANRQTLYTISSVRTEEYRSEFVGHKPASIRIPPIIMDAQILFVRQTGPDACELAVCVPGETPEAAAKRAPFQTMPITGLVDTPIAANENYLALATDRGEMFLYEKMKTDRQPLRQIARGAGGDLRNHRSVRYITLSGKNIWIADRQLMKFETQLSQGRLLPGNAVKKDIETWVRPFNQDETLYHTFQRPGRGGVSVEAISLRDDSVRWETEIAAPIVIEPRSISDSELLLYTGGGRAYRLDEKMISSQLEGRPVDKTSFDGVPVIALPPDSFAGISLGSVIPLENGLEAWVPRIERAADHSLSPSKDNRLFLIYDPTLSEATRFRSLLLPASPATIPVPLGGNLLIPLNDGRVLLTDPRSGNSVAPAFTPVRDTMEPALWGPLVATENQNGFLIVDNQPDKEKKYILYRVALEGDGKEKQFVSKDRIILEHPVLAPIAILGNEFVLIDVRGNVVVVRTSSIVGEPLTENSVQKLKDRLVWGPSSVEGAVLWATADANLHALYSGGKTVSVASPIPIGKVLQSGNHIILNSSSGTLWKLDLNGLNSVYSRETGTRPAVGPTRLGSRILIASEDGSVYTFEEP